MSKIQIERGILIPPKRVEIGIVKYPFKEMEVGDSFFVAGKKAGQITGACRRHIEKGMKYTMRTMNDGVRVWRIQ